MYDESPEFEDVYDEDNVFYIDDETSEYLLNPVRSQFKACFSGILTSLEPLLLRLIFFALVKRILVFLHKTGFFNEVLLKLCLAVSGLVFLNLQDGMLGNVFGFFALLVSFMLLKPFCFHHFGFFSLLHGLGCLLLWQYLYSAETFTSVRGCMMVLVMKFVSVCVDMENGLIEQMSPFTFFAYMLDASTSAFGPWISVAEFEESLKWRSFKDFCINWLRGLAVIAVSVVFVIYSSCAVEALFPKSGFWSAFGIAQSFRVSHYFICWLSAGSAILSGCDCGFVSDWWHVEVPRSLVDVVVYWNVPMHRFLRKYVFAEIRHKGLAVSLFVTYAVSSLLHGINFQLSGVLLTLGYCTYVETKLRNRLSLKFSACIRATVCQPNCKHVFGQRSALALMANFFFCLLAMIHLVYLGAVFDGSAAESGYSMKHTLSVWSRWKYSTHLITVALHIFVYFLKSSKKDS